MGKTPIKHTLAGYIIKKTDTEGYRSGKLTGEKHLNKITEMMGHLKFLATDRTIK